MYLSTFNDFVICQRMTPLRYLSPHGIDRIFQGKTFEMLLSPKQELAQKVWNDFKFQLFSQYFCFLKCTWSPRCSCRFASPCMAPAIELLCFLIHTTPTMELLFIFLANCHFLTPATPTTDLLIFPCRLSLLDPRYTHNGIGLISLQIVTPWLIQHPQWNCSYNTRNGSALISLKITPWFIQNPRWNCWYNTCDGIADKTPVMELLIQHPRWNCSYNTHDGIALISLQITTYWFIHFLVKK